jgi:hypothetical protein
MRITSSSNMKFWPIIRLDLLIYHSHKFHERLKLNVDVVVGLIGRGLADPSNHTQTKLQQDAMKCFQVRFTATM